MKRKEDERREQDDQGDTPAISERLVEGDEMECVEVEEIVVGELVG